MNTIEMIQMIAYDFKERDDEIERLREAMQEFVDRCDRGEVLSKYTYAKFKRLLCPAEGVADE